MVRNPVEIVKMQIINVQDCSLKMIKKKIEHSETFKFQKANRAEIEKNIRNLDISKVCQENDIPTKIIKEHIEIFAEFIENNFSSNIEKAEFPDLLKMADIKPMHKPKPILYIRKTPEMKRVIIDQSAYCQIYLKSMKEFYVNKCHYFLKIFCLDTNAVLEKVLALNISY